MVRRRRRRIYRCKNRVWHVLWHKKWAWRCVDSYDSLYGIWAVFECIWCGKQVKKVEYDGFAC